MPKRQTRHGGDAGELQDERLERLESSVEDLAETVRALATTAQEVVANVLGRAAAPRETPFCNAAARGAGRFVRHRRAEFLRQELESKGDFKCGQPFWTKDGTINEGKTRVRKGARRNVRETNRVEFATAKGISDDEQLCGPSFLDIHKSHLTLKVPKEDGSQNNHFFFSKCTMLGKVCKFIIDGNSCDNLVSEEAVHKLNLRTEGHPRPYAFISSKREHDIEVTQRVLIAFSIGPIYKDEIWCDVVPMDGCHLQLGKPWISHRKVRHNIETNTYRFMFEGIRIKLLPRKVVVGTDPKCPSAKLLNLSHVEDNEEKSNTSDIQVDIPPTDLQNLESANSVKRAESYKEITEDGSAGPLHCRSGISGPDSGSKHQIENGFNESEALPLTIPKSYGSLDLDKNQESYDDFSAQRSLQSAQHMSSNFSVVDSRKIEMGNGFHEVKSLSLTIPERYGLHHSDKNRESYAIVSAQRSLQIVHQMDEILGLGRTCDVKLNCGAQHLSSYIVKCIPKGLGMMGHTLEVCNTLHDTLPSAMNHYKAKIYELHVEFGISDLERAILTKDPFYSEDYYHLAARRIRLAEIEEKINPYTYRLKLWHQVRTADVFNIKQLISFLGDIHGTKLDPNSRTNSFDPGGYDAAAFACPDNELEEPEELATVSLNSRTTRKA